MVLMGRLGYTPTEIGKFTLRDAFNAIEGFAEYDEYLSRGEWERTRTLAYLVLSGWGVKRKGGGKLTPESLIPLMWDKKLKKERHKYVEPLTEEKKAEITKKLGL